MERTKDKTMIVLTPAMVAVDCAEGVGLVGRRWIPSLLYRKYWRLYAFRCSAFNGSCQEMLSE